MSVLFTESLQPALNLRDQGIAEADRGSDVWWKSCADQAIASLAATGRPFTSDDVRALGVPEPSSHKAWGGRYTAAAARGLIVAVGWATSANPGAHARPVRIWRGVS